MPRPNEVSPPQCPLFQQPLEQKGPRTRRRRRRRAGVPGPGAVALIKEPSERAFVLQPAQEFMCVHVIGSLIGADVAPQCSCQSFNTLLEFDLASDRRIDVTGSLTE